MRHVAGIAAYTCHYTTGMTIASRMEGSRGFSQRFHTNIDNDGCEGVTSDALNYSQSIESACGQCRAISMCKYFSPGDLRCSHVISSQRRHTTIGEVDILLLLMNVLIFCWHFAVILNPAHDCAQLRTAFKYHRTNLIIIILP